MVVLANSTNKLKLCGKLFAILSYLPFGEKVSNSPDPLALCQTVMIQTAAVCTHTQGPQRWNRWSLSKTWTVKISLK